MTCTKGVILKPKKLLGGAAETSMTQKVSNYKLQVMICLSQKLFHYILKFCNKIELELLQAFYVTRNMISHNSYNN